ncbi:protocadherin-16-like isoform X2 [Clavelina lepadiformis]|uniref:protocadherin-16-like isoform X2 n=1 Tax=Clavelina lepadiformis TaxID=159417 RepID=UPI004041B244
MLWWLVTLLWLTTFEQSHAQGTVSLDFNVTENATIGTEVGRLQQSGVAGGYILTSDESSPFLTHFDVNLLQDQGILLTIKALDHEEYSQFDEVAYDSIKNNYIQIHIDVIDINDNSPQFITDQLDLNISEASQVGASFNLGSATDDDSEQYNVQGYRIISGNDAQVFGIKNNMIDNKVYADLVVNQTLDREEKPSYTLVIEAYDGDVPPKTDTVQLNIKISDVNDETPMFNDTRYTVDVPEDAVVGTDLITLTAEDRDAGDNSKVTYRINRVQSDPDEYFMVDSETGRIYLNKKVDFETKIQHKVVLEAVDSGTEPQVGSTVVIITVTDVNDNKPSINVIFLDANEAKVSEGAQLGDYIARVSVSDPDMGELSLVNLTISGGDGRFGLQTDNDIIYLICIKTELDRETKASYDITLTATDFGSPPQTAITSFTLTIEDVNDNPPRFEEEFYEFSLKEDVYLGTFVAQLQANDIDEGLNAQVLYSIESGAQSDWFTVHPSSGVITTAKDLDNRINSAPTLVVIATDKGTPPMSSNTTLLIRINATSDSAPTFESSSYRKSVFEDAPIGRCIFQVRANDPDTEDDSTLVYSFVIGSTVEQPTAFSVNFTTGEICLSEALDWETVNSYELDIQATDQIGLWDRTRVYVTVDDINEHRPVFHPAMYVVNVDRNADVDSPVTKVSANDTDDPTLFGRISYQLTSGNENGFFKLDSITGDLTVSKSLGDLVDGMNFQLLVEAVDGGGFTSELDARIIISINGSTTGGPVFSSSSYEFTAEEDVPVSYLLGRVSASAVDGNAVKYSIISDPPYSSWFDVESTSGEVTVKAKMDREIFFSVTFQVVASSGTPPKYGFALVTVTLNDVNDNYPIVRGAVDGELNPITVPYNTGLGVKLTTINARDNDAGLNGTVRYLLSSSSTYFSINYTTGELSLKSNLAQQSMDYRLSIEVRDLGSPPHIILTSLVVRARPPDVNCPEFSNSDYKFNVMENFEPSKIIGTVRATASSSSAAFSYRIVSSPSALLFAIYPNGTIYLNSKLDRETQDSYRFEILAEGFPGPISEYTTSCVSTTDVIITVDDVDDNPPQFTSSIYTFSVEENANTGTVLGSVAATDKDIGQNAAILYDFAVSSSKFAINPQTGQISTSVPLNFESEADYFLIVQARGYQNMAQAKIHVILVDVNDNSPIFVAGEGDRLAVVPGTAETGTWVADMKAYDADHGANGEIVYSIIPSSSPSFSINSQTGVVSTSSPFSVTGLGNHTLRIEARDKGTPQNSAFIMLKVKVQQANTNPAMFDDTHFVFSPSEGGNPGSVLGSFNVALTARRRRSTSSYRIISGNDDNAFSVNRNTGEVTQNRYLDYEASPQYTLTVEKQISSTSSSILVGQINIRDINDHTPKFSSGYNSFGVTENTATGEKVYTFTATDQDTGPDGLVTYSLVSESPAHAFVIDADSGALSVDTSLDREEISEYILVIKATDRSATSPRFSTASCNVIIRDINDNPPIFVSRRETYLLEDEPVGYPLMRVAAEDKDSGANGRVLYMLVSASSDDPTPDGKDEMSYFHIDPNTGVISLAKELDRERATVHHLNISATDSSALNQLTSYESLVIHVSDVNDIAPRFEQSVYQAQVTESQSSGVIVVRVRATDEDSGKNGKLTYVLQESSDSEAFSIDSTNGVITTTRALDRENRSSYKLTVYVEDGSFPSLYDWCVVHVSVVDINDNSPQFSLEDNSREPPLFVKLDLPEQVETPTLVFIICALDTDDGDNGKITYTITAGNEDADFSLNSTTGALRAIRSLDRETTPTYQLTVMARDNGEPRLSSVGVVEINVLDWNDNDPQFPQSSFSSSIEEGLPEGQYVFTVRATDADEGLNGNVRYFLDSNDFSNTLDGLFSINQDTGVISTIAALDREAKSQHVFSVIAVDSSPYNPRISSVPVDVTVTDVNDNSPVFDEPLIRVNVTRSVATGVDLAQVIAQDKDLDRNGSVTYSFADGSTTESVFSIDVTTGTIRTTASIPMDFPSQYVLFVNASDQGNPPLSAQAVVVILIGETTAKLQFDEASYGPTMLEIVTDGYRVTKVTAQPVGTTITGSIVYNFLSGNDEAFSISSDGEITVVDRTLLDYETRPNIRLVVYASASSDSSGTVYGFTTVNVQLQDENDNSPRFSSQNYYAKILEQEPATDIVQVSATDPDSGNNGRVRYDIISGDTDNVFAVDAATGVVRTSRRLDYEIQSSYSLTIHATDLPDDTARRTGTCTVQVTVVDANDHRPTLVVPSEPVVVDEGTVVGKVVTVVTANDIDQAPPVTFLFRPDGNPGGYFSIDRMGGRLFLAKPLDYETVQNLSLEIEALNGRYNSTAKIEIIVADVNDNAPTFDQDSYQATLDELASAGTSVITIHADDVDSGSNGRVSYRLGSIVPNIPIFAIDPDTGEIHTNASVTFTSQSALINLEVEAFDHGEPPIVRSTSVRIERRDENNHAPMYGKTTYEAQVTESALRNASVVNVTASDADYERNNKDVYFEILAGNVADVFKIRSYTGLGGESIGEICVAGDLDRETTDSYTLTVSAFDRGSPQRNSNATVLIRVTDDNDNRPRFNQSHYYGRVQENNEAGTASPNPVLTVVAFDPDDQIPVDLEFKVISGDSDRAFELVDCIPPSDGCALLNAKTVDYETKTHYELTVQVTNLRSPLLAKSTASIAVDIEDVNEFKPEISVLIDQVDVLETARANETLFYITALDNDGGSYGRITFEVLDVGRSKDGSGCPDPRSLFAVVPVTGAVYATQNIDFEQCSSFSFQVRACDLDQCSDPISIVLNVIPVDEYPPQFVIGGQVTSDPEFKFSVPYGSPTGYIVGKINATDQDGGVDGVIHFTLQESPSPSRPTFVINNDTGVIGLAQQLDSGDPRYLTLTIESSTLETRASVTVTITGVPAAIALGSILAIVFGILLGIAFIIGVFVLVRCCCMRRYSKDPDTVPKKVGSPASKQESFHDLPKETEHPSPDSPKYAAVNGMNGSHHNGTLKNGGKAIGNGSSGDYQLKAITSASKKGRRIFQPKNTSLQDDPCNGHVAATTAIYNRPMNKNSNLTSLNQSPEDDEVNYITSSSPSSGRQPTSVSPLNEVEHRVADSGIQQDIERISETTEATKRTSPAGSSASIHQLEDEGVGRVMDTSKPPYSSSIGRRGKAIGELPGLYESLATMSRPIRKPLPKTFLGSLDEGKALPERPSDQLQDWTPEFNPLSSVFSEIARLREETAAVIQTTLDQQPRESALPTNGQPSETLNVTERPPPLLTTVPQHTTSLANPVPMTSSIGRRLGRQLTNPPMKGLCPKSQPIYQQPLTLLPTTHSKRTSIPPSYSYVISKRPSSGESSKSRHSLGSKSHVSSLAYQTSDNTMLSLTSLPRSPFSHDSSLTSPAMSPSLSPSLTPLTVRTPPDTPVIVRDPPRAKIPPQSGVVKRSRSDETNLTSEKKERILHV